MGYSEFTEQYKPSVPRIFNLLIYVVLFTFIISCKENKEDKLDHQQGEMTIWVDPANKNLIEALTEVYMMKFPKVKFHFVYEPENVILKNIIDLKAEAAFINKPLTEEQSNYIFGQTTVKPRSTLLAYDAVIFIAGKESKIEFVSLDELKEGVATGNNKFVFDNGNSGNFNTIKEQLKIKIPKDLKIPALENASQLIEFVNKSPGTVGIIGMNTISEKDNPEVKSILEKIKVLPIKNNAGELKEATTENILNFEYPFFKGVYFIVREPGFGIGSGFTRFAGSQQGQLIVGREGLQPNFLYEREVKIQSKPL